MLEVCVITGLVVRDDLNGSRVGCIHFHGREDYDKILSVPLPGVAMPVDVLWHPCITWGGLRLDRTGMRGHYTMPNALGLVRFVPPPPYATHVGYNFGASDVDDSEFIDEILQSEESRILKLIMRRLRAGPTYRFARDPSVEINVETYWAKRA
jgi:hypothetical protein